MLLGLSIAVSAMMIEIGKNRIRWYKWRSQGTEPIVIVGELVKLVRLEGKKRAAKYCIYHQQNRILSYIPLCQKRNSKLLHV